MAKSTIVGMREYNFTDDNGRNVEGMSVYIKVPLQTEDGRIAKGFTTDKLSVKKNTPLYAKMLAANYDKPFEAETQFDILPGSKRPQLAEIIF